MARIMLAVLLTILILGGHIKARGSDDRGDRKLLIEFGWDEPDTAFLLKHAAKMANSPFDGCVFHAVARPDNAPVENFAWKTWGRRVFSEAELSQARNDLKSTRFGHFNQNFLRVNTAPADLDWFDDHTAVLSNLKLAASLANDGRCRGVLLDTEQYQGKLFNFAKQRDAKTKSFDDYAQQARLRGSEVMSALQEGMPGLTVLITFGPSYVAQKAAQGKIKPSETEYGLLVPFVEGMASTVQEGTRLIDGHEPSYGYREPEQFDAALARIRNASAKLEAGFGLWLDYDWTAKGWNLDDLEKNHFSPAGFEEAVAAALDRSDEIVWIYTETPRWWTKEGTVQKLPESYVQALRNARSKRVREDD